MKKIYFGILGQYGDIIMQEPGLRKYIEENPHDKIVMGASVKYPGALELYKNYHPNIVDFKIWNSYGDYPTEEDKKYLNEQKFDYVFNARPKHTEKDFILKRHQVIEAALVYGINIDDTQIILKNDYDIVKDDKAISFSLFPNFPRGGVKSLSIKKITDIVRFINDMGFKAIHLNGPSEPDIPGSSKVKGTYLQGVKAMLSSKMLITVDTGMSWAAAAFQHPTVGLYSWAYYPKVKTSKNWQPNNKNATYLEKQCVEQIFIKDIKKAVEQKLETIDD